MELIYLDYNCFQRGFDDPRQMRIQMEALACQEVFLKAERKATFDYTNCEKKGCEISFHCRGTAKVVRPGIAPEWGFRGYAVGFRGYAVGLQGYAVGFRGYAVGLRGYAVGR